MKKLIPIIVLVLFCTNITLTSCGSSETSNNADQTVSETDNIESNVPPLSDKTLNQYGYQVTVEKVELAEKETRVFVNVANNGDSNFSLYGFNCNLLQGSSQYDYQTNYNADYPEIQTDLIPGMQTSGVICFPAIDPDIPFSLLLDASSDNYFDEDVQPYRFDIE